MAHIDVKEDKYNSLMVTSTPYKSIHDSGYNTPSSTLSNASSNLHQISEASISFDQSPSNLGLDLQLSSAIHHFTQDYNGNKLEDITNTSNFDNHFSPLSYTCQELSPSKKFKLSSDMRLRFRMNKCLKNNENQFLRRKNSTVLKNVIYERISLEGREKVDFMYFLSERHHFELVTDKIFLFLSGNDIVSMSMVSKIWCNAVKNSPIAQKKKRMYFKLSKENRENNGRDRLAIHNKGYLANISNVMRSPSKRDLPQRSPPVSPSKYRSHIFQKEAKKLSSDQQLVKCPRCSRPASWSPSQSTRAECQGFHCKFVFCTNCLCEYTDNFIHKCLTLTSPISVSSCSRRSLISNLTRRKHYLRRL